MAPTPRSFGTLALILAASPALLQAQGATTSALSGLDRDPPGRPVAGALVRVSSPAMIGGEKVARTSENGSYGFRLAPTATLCRTAHQCRVNLPKCPLTNCDPTPGRPLEACAWASG